ncbi:MAG: DUF3078 domain-containing protein [Bacteroidia bacterium]|nr:DUF3078 domain-containing protein [Bacteroidia bacterium]
MKLNLLVLSLLPLGVFAQTDSLNLKKPSLWTTNLQTGLNISQASYSGNWKAGGINSISLGTFLNFKAVKKTENYEWNNDLQLLYGTVKNEGQDIRKNADRIFFDSKYARKISKHWNLFASLNFMSQFDAGFEYKSVAGVETSRRISAFLAPGYLTEALGFEYKPVTYFSAQFGVGALRQTFVTDQKLYDNYDVTAKEYNELYGVKRGDNMRNQVVFQMVLNFDKEIMKNVTLKSRYMGLLDYERLEPQYIVSRLDVSITAKVNKYISTNLNGVLLYDFDQDKDVQYSQVISLGVLYSFSNKK